MLTFDVCVYGFFLCYLKRTKQAIEGIQVKKKLYIHINSLDCRCPEIHLNFTDCNTLCSYCGLHRQTVAMLPNTVAMMMMMMTMILWICRTSSNASAVLACALCLQCVHTCKRSHLKKRKAKEKRKNFQKA